MTASRPRAKGKADPLDYMTRAELDAEVAALETSLAGASASSRADLMSSAIRPLAERLAPGDHAHFWFRCATLVKRFGLEKVVDPDG